MTPYWLVFLGREAACVESSSEIEARILGEQLTKRDVVGIWPLPYPAEPRLGASTTPSFCFQPETCKGRTSCPRRHSCTE
jgi:hypothetical protein